MNKRKAEMESMALNMVSLQGELGRSRAMVDSLHADCKQLLEEADFKNRHLQDENASLQKCLDEKTDLLATEQTKFNEQHQQLQSALDTASAQRQTAEDTIVELQSELARAAEAAKEKEQKLTEQTQEIAFLKEDYECLDACAERLEKRNMEFCELDDRQTKQIKDLQKQLVQSASVCSSLEAERDQLRRQNATDSELHCQPEHLQSELVAKESKICLLYTSDAADE